VTTASTISLRGAKVHRGTTCRGFSLLLGMPVRLRGHRVLLLSRTGVNRTRSRCNSGIITLVSSLAQDLISNLEVTTLLGLMIRTIMIIRVLVENLVLLMKDILKEGRISTKVIAVSAGNISLITIVTRVPEGATEVVVVTLDLLVVDLLGLRRMRSQM
jgi:hypothetical protein